MSFSVAVLTGLAQIIQEGRIHSRFPSVSDTASRGASADKSGPTVRDILSQNGFRIVMQQVLPDEEELVRACVMEWCEQGDVSWVITTGGTGFGIRDRTPEVSTVHSHFQKFFK